jgi:hypothetical protein
VDRPASSTGRRAGRGEAETIARIIVLGATGPVVGILTLNPILGVLAGIGVAIVVTLTWRAPKERAQAARIAQLRAEVTSLSRRPDMSDPAVRQDVERSLRARGWRG